MYVYIYIYILIYVCRERERETETETERERERDASYVKLHRLNTCDEWLGSRMEHLCWCWVWQSPAWPIVLYEMLAVIVVSNPGMVILTMCVGPDLASNLFKTLDLVLRLCWNVGQSPGSVIASRRCLHWYTLLCTMIAQWNHPCYPVDTFILYMYMYVYVCTCQYIQCICLVHAIIHTVLCCPASAAERVGYRPYAAGHAMGCPRKRGGLRAVGQ